MNKPKYQGIKTPRLEIRPLRPGDYRAWRDGYLSRFPKVNRFDGGRPAATKVSKRAFLKKLKDHKTRAKKDQCYCFSIFDRNTGKHLGTTDIYIFVRDRLQWANLGYEIHNQYWRLGYAKEAAKASIQIGFRHLKLHRIEASMELSHKASIATARAAGMKAEGIRKRFFKTGPVWKDYLILAAIP